MKSKLMFKDIGNKLRTVDFEDNNLNLHAVKKQVNLKMELMGLGLKVKDKTPVLCLLYDL